MDLLMPKKSGLDIIKELRADPETANIPVIVASNMSQKAVVGEAMDIGANDYFIKSQSTIADIISKAEKYI